MQALADRDGLRLRFDRDAQVAFDWPAGFGVIHEFKLDGEAVLWREAQTLKPLGQPWLWNASLGVGLCGDWCIGHRVEDAFVSGLELALAIA